jgi:lysophospholipase L1-like esterase
MRKYHQRSATLIPAGTTLFIGDSLIQGLCVVGVCDRAVNYGIGGDTTKGVLKRLGDYHFDNVEAVVLAVGTNDFKYRNVEKIEANMSEIITKIPSHVTILISAVLPVNEGQIGKGRNTKIAKLNQLYSGIARMHGHVFFMKHKAYFADASSNLRKELQVGDGVHLNNAGNQLWALRLKKGLMAGKKLRN